MANHASHAALDYPIKNARYTILIPYLDADGDPTDPTTPDTELSKDDGSAADAAEEVASPKNSVAMLTLTGAETDCSCLSLAGKAASGPKTTLATIYPAVLASVGTGTLSAGSAGGGTLGTLLAYDVTGCFIQTTGGTGGGGTGGANNQARKIVTYNTGTGAFTVTPNWETTPSTDTTYTVLLPKGVTLGMLKTLNPATAGRTLVVDSAGLADANMVKGGPTGSGVAVPAALITNLTTIYNTDYATVYDTTNKAFLSKLGNFAMGGSSLALTTGAISGTTLTLSGAVAFQSTFIVSGATTLTGAVTASNASNNITGIDVAKISGDATAADNAEAFFDGTGYAGTNNVIPTVTTLTGHTAQTGDGYAILSSGTHGNAALKTLIDTLGNFVDTEVADIQSRLPAALVSGRMDSSVGAMAANTLTASALATDAVTEIQSGLATASALTTVAGNVTDILADTSELQTDWADGGRLDLLVDAILADTDSLDTTKITTARAAVLTDWIDGGRLDLILDARASQSSVDTLATYVDTEVAAILTAVDTEVGAIVTAVVTTIPATLAGLFTATIAEPTYRTDGASGSLAQLIYEINQNLGDFSIASTTKTTRKVDGSTTAFTATLNSATTPTAITRS